MKQKNGWITRTRIAYSFAGAALGFLLAMSDLPTVPVVALAMGILFGVLITLLALDAQEEINKKAIESESQNTRYLEMVGDVQDFEELVRKRRKEISSK